MDWENTRARTKIAFDILSLLVGAILGLVMIGQGVQRICMGFDGDGRILYYIGYSIMILGGSSVVVLSFKDRVRMTGAYALTLGLSRLCLRCGDICSTTQIYIIVVELLFVVLALNLSRIGFHFARGNVVSRTSLILTASILASTDLFLIIAQEYIEQYSITLPFEIDPYYYILNFLMYVALVALLDTRVIRENTIMARYTLVLDRIRAAHSLEEGSYIYDDVARDLMERSGPSWRRIDDGMVQSEMVFDIFTGELRSTAVVQIWKGKEPLFMTVMHEGDSIFNANRFRVDRFTESDGVLYGLGKDGTRFRILIKGRDPNEF